MNLSRRNARFHKIMNFLLIVLALLSGWMIWILVLSLRENRACGSVQASRNNIAQAEKSSEIQRILDRFSEAYQGIGIQASIILPDGTHWKAVSGYADLEKKCPVTYGHHFPIGSMTKLFTATLVLDQVGKGNLSLDDPISRWIQIPAGEDITPRMLLNHTSGISDYAWDTWFLARLFGLPGKRWQPAELVQSIQYKHLRFIPGSRHEYSNTNYLLLGLILEQVSGQTYQDLLHSTITYPLTLEDTFFQEIPPGMEIANGYDESLLHLGRRNLTALRPAWLSAGFSAGGIVSTSEDTARFTQALFTGQIIPNDLVYKMLNTIEAPDLDLPEQVGYGLGVRRLNVNSSHLAGHTGTLPGYSGFAMYQLVNGNTIVILSNLSTIAQVQMIREIQNQLRLDK